MSDTTIINETLKHKNLCDWCSKFDFAGWFQIGKAKRDPQRSEIRTSNVGYLQEIRKEKNCVFCRMLVHIANLHFDGDLGPEDGLPPNGHLRVLVTPIVIREVEAKRKPQQIRRLEIQFEGTHSSMSPYQIQMLDDSVTGEQIELWRDDQKRRGVNVPVDVEDLKEWKPFDGALGTSGGLLASGDLDISLVSRWLDNCVKNHGNTCSMLRADRGDRETRTLIKGGFRLGSDIRVIDVSAMRICPAPKGLAYCALSYLWGGVSMLKTTKDNFDMLSQENGIREDEVPLTIRDAIHFCRKIGWQYLWVDALCIIQDDEGDKASQISQMQAIYRFADFTIVASSGIDSNAGLPGVCTPRKVSQHIAKIQGMRLVTTLSPFDHILETSRWNTRAWTFQESQLSRRLIVFADDQVHFRCEGGEYCEDTRVESPRSKQTEYGNPFQSRSLLRGAPHGRGFEIFQDLVSQYSLKQLSFPDDVLNGFSGIINALRPFGNIGQTWRAGLPLDRLVESLLWIPTYRPHYELRRISAVPAHLDQPRFDRRGGSYNPVHDHYERCSEEKAGVVNKFPSWSWIGWAGEIDYLNEPPGSIRIDCKASAGHYLLNINARIRSFNVRRSTKAGIALTNFSVFDILDSGENIISDFVQDHSLIPSANRDEAQKYDFLLLVTCDPKYAKNSVRPRQWKSSSRFVATALPMGGKPPREAHNGPFLNTMMINRPDTYPQQPAERVALAYIPRKYWDAKGVVREDVVIG